MKTKYLYYFFWLLLVQSTHASSQAKIIKSVSPDTKLIEWQLTEHNLQLKLIQRLPDQTRSFFEARGFPADITNKIANSCVFQTITRNNSIDKNQTIHISLKKWLVKTGKTSQPVKLKEVWDKEWENTQVKTSSKIAFRWATFPTEQSFEPSGDYNWGMISFGPEPGSVFDLYIEWKFNDTTASSWIKNISCPKNR